MRSSNGRKWTITSIWAPAGIRARREYPTKLAALLACSQLPGFSIVWTPAGNVESCLPGYHASQLLERKAL